MDRFEITVTGQYIKHLLNTDEEEGGCALYVICVCGAEKKDARDGKREKELSESWRGKEGEQAEGTALPLALTLQAAVVMVTHLHTYYIRTGARTHKRREHAWSDPYFLFLHTHTCACARANTHE